jgi:zinc transporter 9
MLGISMGYGKAAFVWGMISALGMLWAGGGVSILHGMQTLVSPDHTPTLNWESWAVLGFSFVVDGSVLMYSMRELASRTSQQFADVYPKAGLVQKANLIWQHMRHSSDPFMTAVALEDVAACAGVVVAASGIGLSQLIGTPACDSIASIAIGGMLSTVAVILVRLNMRYLIGQSINSEKSSEIASLIRSFPAIDGVRYVHTQWLSPSSFSLSAKIDFDGTYLAAKLHREYEDLFLKSTNLHDDLPLFLSFYAEDVTRLVETELKSIEGSIREKFLEPQ